MKPEYFIPSEHLDRLITTIKSLKFLTPSIRIPRSVTDLVKDKKIDRLHEIWDEQRLEPFSASVANSLTAIKHGSIEPYVSLLKKLEMSDRTIAVSAAAQRGHDSEAMLIKELEKNGAFAGARTYKQEGFCKEDEKDLFNVHPDLVVEKDGKLKLFEIKSTSKGCPKRIDELSRPYYYQVQMYMRSLRISQAHVIYIDCDDIPNDLTGLTELKISDCILTVPKDVNWISYIEKEMRIFYKYMYNKHKEPNLDHFVQF